MNYFVFFFYIKSITRGRYMDICWNQLQVVKWKERMRVRKRLLENLVTVDLLSLSIACLFVSLYLCLHVNSICKYNFSLVINFQRKIQAINQIKSHLLNEWTKQQAASNERTNEYSKQYPHIRHNLLSSARNAKQKYNKKIRPIAQYVERIDTLYRVQ